MGQCSRYCLHGLQIPTIATLDLRIGWLAGQFRRKAGAARTRARAARQQLEDVPECELDDWILPGSGAGARHHLLVLLSGAFCEQSEEYRSSDLAGIAWRGSSAGACAIFWLWTRHAFRSCVILEIRMTK